MFGEPAESSRSGPSHPGEEPGKPQSANEQQGGNEGERRGERIGPLTVTRSVNGDGRKLILYARAQDEHR
jgi:hypothetical protein